MCSSDIFLGVLAILFPPLPVWVKTGICSIDSLINILLCCLGFLPGLLHAWYIIAKFPDPFDAEYQAIPADAEGGRVAGRAGAGNERLTYVFVQAPNAGAAASAQSQSRKNQTYGTTSAPVVPSPQQGSNGAWSAESGEGSSAVPPPSYEHAVGDHKVQTRD